MNVNLENMIFVAGCSNSGTKTLFYNILNHPDVGGFTKELHNYGICPMIHKTQAFLFAVDGRYEKYYAESENCSQEVLGITTKKEFEIMINQKAGKIKDWIDGERLIFKDPRLSLRIKWLRNVFETCYIIVIIRNPYCAIEGIMRRGKATLNKAIEQWKVTNDTIQRDVRNTKKLIVVRYEDMVSDKNFFKMLFKFLDLPYKEFHKRIYPQYSKIVRNMNLKSIRRLSKEQINIINSELSDDIESLNYKILGV